MELFLVIVILTQISSSFAYQDSNETSERLIKAVGTKEQFLVELSKISAYASSLRHGLQNSINDKWLEGGQGIVVPITFEDGVKWAAKVSVAPGSINSATKSLRAIERYCPDIPAPRVQGMRGRFISNPTIKYYIVEWMEGRSLWDDEHAGQYVYDYHRSSMNEKVLSGLNVTLSEKIVSQLAEFVYNLTTCPIPHAASKSACYLADWW
jgi:hypothetical protein